MISNFDLAKALRDYLKTLVSLDVINATESAGYTPSPSASYIQEKVMLGNKNISLSPGDSENANGIYQIDLYAALGDNTLKNRFAALDYIDTLKANFTKGLTAGIAHNGQKVIVNEVNTPPERMNEANTHRIHTLDVNFRVIG